QPQSHSIELDEVSKEAASTRAALTSNL
nr:Chain J, Monalysin [Pseudomonas entomophila L48]4MJT_K Chain K, Monalysin [Pseudomonas entomophila L48]4MJT_L Chain L, Monalysin [Pseudomonas entomophila L48]4MJT_M Chain M, Monalysin [Pseudomonas entomophila L48]4MJT_N Chain N, Monalysin [Pseudomonas entomophila L48]4MJT_O Chain O, Monalysin [Pseudomonas entomophila L48]4MJT_P Chain P, Monalysin [Pseudomonas entomophila L48]4MJT_Q Chain Q, Monalysin [Pseudomonas entomophila L48]4MJT_R Chain R, Monalysin [Pseudomonas entomophila L48]4MK